MENENTNPQISRRDFMKVLSTGVLAGMIGPYIKPTLIKQNFSNSQKEDGWYPGLCKMCMQGDCVTRVHVIDGVVVQVEGDTRAPNNRGTLCPKGNAAIMNMYNPYRVKAPVKRTNPKKGLDQDPGWMEISYEEALETVVEKLKKVHEDDPRKLVMVSGFGQVGAYFSALLPFMSTFGSPNDVPSRGSACAVHFGTMMVQGQFPIATTDSDRCEYVLTFGRDFGPNHSVTSTGTRAFLGMLERGAKVISIEPRCSPMASKCTEWIPIRPGTDMAFLLGMLHTILIEDGIIDTWFIKNRTNAPYLIGADGDYVRDSSSKKPLLWDEVEGKALPFDEITPLNCALEGEFTVNDVECRPAFTYVKAMAGKYTPEWAEEISTVPASKIREVARDFVKYARIGSTIDIDGYTFPFRPISIAYQRGAYQHTLTGVFGDLVGKIIMELVGALEVPGGTTGNWTPSPATIFPDEDGVVAQKGESAGEAWHWPLEAVDSRSFYPLAHTKITQLAKAILDPEAYHLSYEPEVLFTCGGNPIHAGFDRKLFEEAYAKVPFSFCVSLIFDEPAMMADIVFAEDSFMERDLMEPGPLSIMQPHKISEDATRNVRVFPWRDVTAIKKVFNTTDIMNVLNDITERLGLLTGEGGFTYFIGQGVNGITTQVDINRRYSGREFADAFLKEHFGADLSVDTISDATGPVFLYPFKDGGPHKENHNYFYFPENTTRHPIYMRQLLVKGRELKANIEAAGLKGVPGWEDDMDYFWSAYSPVPEWIPGPELERPEGFDLWAINWKTPAYPFYTGDTHGNPWLHDVIKTHDPYEFAIWLNSETASKKGLRDGDSVVVESRYGKASGFLKVTELIHPEVVGIPASHGKGSSMVNPITLDGPNFNALPSAHEQTRSVDPITAGIDLGPAVKVYKA